MTPSQRELGTADAWAALWRMREYLRPYLVRTALMLVLGLLGVITAVSVPLLLRRVIDGPLADGRGDGVPLLVGLVATLGVVEAMMGFWRRWLQSTTAVAMERSIRDDLYSTMQTLPPSFHDRWHTGQLLSRMTGDLSTIRRFSGFGLVIGAVNVIQISVVSGLLIWLDPILGVVVACSLVPITVASRRFGRRFGVVSRRVQDGQGDLTTLIEESATGVRVVKAFGRREQLTERFRRDAEELRAVRLSMAYLRAHVISVLGAIPNATLVVVLLLGSGAVASGRLTLGELVAFITLSLQLIWPIEATGFILASAQEAATASQRVYELVDADPEIVSAPTVPGSVSAGRGPSTRVGVRFEDVSFRYPGSTTAVLDGVRLEIAPGETVAVAGASGAGKTTLAALLPRLADPTSGRVLLDGHDLRDLPLPLLRTVVATGFEDPVLFSASVRENVTLGRPEATEDELHEALQVAQAGFVDDLPWGLETRIGEQGMSLSGGQRQRIALARAVLGRPRVLVLDDPLSALDVETEALVEQALRRVLAGTTALIVVHRPSTVALADRVALLHEGRLDAVGTHRELLATSARYAALMGEEDVVDVAAVDVEVRR